MFKKNNETKMLEEFYEFYVRNFIRNLQKKMDVKCGQKSAVDRDIWLVRGRQPLSDFLSFWKFN